MPHVHKWSKWTNPDTVEYTDVYYRKKYFTAQVRFCEKCNKYKVKEVR
jgi:hypothetical protein